MNNLPYKRKSPLSTTIIAWITAPPSCWTWFLSRMFDKCYNTHIIALIGLTMSRQKKCCADRSTTSKYRESDSKAWRVVCSPKIPGHRMQFYCAYLKKKKSCLISGSAKTDLCLTSKYCERDLKAHQPSADRSAAQLHHFKPNTPRVSINAMENRANINVKKLSCMSDFPNKQPYFFLISPNNRNPGSNLNHLFSKWKVIFAKQFWLFQKITKIIIIVDYFQWITKFQNDSFRESQRNRSL